MQLGHVICSPCARRALNAATDDDDDDDDTCNKMGRFFFFSLCPSRRERAQHVDEVERESNPFAALLFFFFFLEGRDSLVAY